MPQGELLSLIGLGLALGARHALDADHVAAVATLLSRSPDLRLSGFIGLWWGFGHTVMLVAAGLSIITFGIAIPPRLTQVLEFAIGLLLVGLGLSLAAALRRDRWHPHGHEHAGAWHGHLHSHRRGPDHVHDHVWRLSVRSLAVGLCHGLAGSATLVLLVVSTVESTWMAALYLLAFGVGSLVGMVVVALAISAPMVWSGRLGGIVPAVVQGLASVASIGVGLAIMLEVGLGQP